jgi:hypothetical protein
MPALDEKRCSAWKAVIYRAGVNDNENPASRTARRSSMESVMDKSEPESSQGGGRRRQIARLTAFGVAAALGIAALAIVLGRVSQTSSACAGDHRCGAESFALILFSVGLGSAALFGLISLIARAEPRR